MDLSMLMQAVLAGRSWTIFKTFFQIFFHSYCLRKVCLAYDDEVLCFLTGYFFKIIYNSTIIFKLP